MTGLFDSDILIDFFHGVEAAAAEIDRYSKRLISRISWIEAQIGARTDDVIAIRTSFLRQFEIVELDAAVAQLTITLRQQHRLKLPDAIVWASAQRAGALLVTRNTKDFPEGEPSVRFPYKI